MFSFSNVSFGRRRTCPDLVLNLKDASGPVKNSLPSHTPSMGHEISNAAATLLGCCREMHLKIAQPVGWHRQRDAL